MSDLDKKYSIHLDLINNIKNGNMKINLTEVFGEGNEPTQDVCDEVFVNYVEGLVE